MTIDEAIKELEKQLAEWGSLAELYFRDAVKLGIEALKRIEDWRAGSVLNPDFMLPGEIEGGDNGKRNQGTSRLNSARTCQQYLGNSHYSS